MFSDLEQKVGTKAVVHFGPVSAEKQRIAEEVASMLKLNVDIDTTSSERLVSFSFFTLCCYILPTLHLVDSLSIT